MAPARRRPDPSAGSWRPGALPKHLGAPPERLRSIRIKCCWYSIAPSLFDSSSPQAASMQRYKVTDRRQNSHPDDVGGQVEFPERRHGGCSHIVWFQIGNSGPVVQVRVKVRIAGIGVVVIGLTP